MSEGIGEFRESQPLTLGVELELQLLSRRDFDLTRGATDLMQALDYDERFGEIKLEITESMIEVSTQPQATVAGISTDLAGLRDSLARLPELRASLDGDAEGLNAWLPRLALPAAPGDEQLAAGMREIGVLARRELGHFLAVQVRHPVGITCVEPVGDIDECRTTGLAGNGRDD